jgi:hypothetical protein
VRKRAEVLYLKSLGFPHTDIQDIARAARTTLASCLKSYLEGGMGWVLANNHHGRAGELDGHAEMMTKYFSENPPASSREAVARVRELTGLSRSRTQARAFMGRLGMKFRKAGFVPGGQKNQEKEGEREEFQKKARPAGLSGRKGRNKAVLRGRGPFCHGAVPGVFVVLCAVLPPVGPRPETVQRAGGVGFKGLKTGHGVQRWPYQRRERLRTFEETGKEKPGGARQGGAGQRQLPAVPKGAGLCRAAGDRTRFPAPLFAPVQPDRALLEVPEKGMFVLKIP